MFKRHPADELGIADESARLDVLLAAWGVNRLEADKRERQRFILERQVNRELALMTGAAVNGGELPEITGDADEELTAPDCYDPLTGDYVPGVVRNCQR
jgi:hypothetical protein